MTPREAAARALYQVSEQGGYSNLVLHGALEPLENERDRAFCTALFYGVLERQITLDYILYPYLRRPPSQLDPLVRVLLHCGLYQIVYLSVPSSAAVFETVSLAKSMGRSRQAGFLNGVLRSFLRDGAIVRWPPEGTDAYDSAYYACPNWLVRLWKRAYGDVAARRMMAASLERPPIFVRANLCRTSIPTLCAELIAAGVQAEPVTELPGCLRVVGAVERLPGLQEGLFHIEDAAAQLAVRLLGARSGETVIDVCAAPGGKSFSIAEVMGDDGRVYAFDNQEHRVGLVAEGARRLGLASIQAAVQDAAQPREELLGSADRVLCDLPCSGLGVIRRKPEIKHKPQQALAGLPKLQSELLRQSARYVRPGGTLLYTTCTLHPSENEQVADRFLAEQQAFAPDPFDEAELPAEFTGIRSAPHQLTLLPGPTDGFFMARWKRAR